MKYRLMKYLILNYSYNYIVFQFDHIIIRPCNCVPEYHTNLGNRHTNSIKINANNTFLF